MSKVAVVFWSGTGNTGIMATKVAEGVTEAGGEATILPADQFNAEMMDSYDAIAFGCPSMGAEQLEESEFEPMFMECEPKLKGKKIALFGSYGWGDGEFLGYTLEKLMQAVNGCVHGKKHVSVMEPLWRVIL